MSRQPSRENQYRWTRESPVLYWRVRKGTNSWTYKKASVIRMNLRSQGIEYIIEDVLKIMEEEE